MTDRVYPSAKPNGTAAATTAATTTAAATTTTNNNHPTATHLPPSRFAPPTKPNLYNPNRHPYRPNPTSLHRHDHRRCSGRRCCFFCCCWFILFLIFIILLSCIAVAAVYFLYRPKSPSFSISSLKISQFNLTTTTIDDTTRLTTKLNLTISSKNPNKKITISYDPITIQAFNHQILLSNGSFPSFTSMENNVTIIHTTLSMANQLLDADSVKGLQSDLKKKNGLPLRVVLETKVKVKMDKVKVRKFGILITCEGIHVRGLLTKGKDPAIATTTNAKCKVDLRFKIWKITF